MRTLAISSLLLVLGTAGGLAAGSLAAGAAASPGRPGAAAPSVPFISDDYETALAQARGRGIPLFIESWAPW